MSSYTATLGTLDQLSPPVHIIFAFCFPTTDTDSAVKNLERGVQRLVKQLPFLSGKISNVTEDGRSHTIISWSDEDPHINLEDVGNRDLPSYADLEQQHMLLTPLSDTLRPLESREPQRFPRLSTFALSYAKLDGGLIMTVAVHHQLMDGGGIELLIKTLAGNTRGEEAQDTIDPLEPLERKKRFEAMISQISEQHIDTALIPSPMASVFDSQSPERPFTTMLLRFSIRALDQLRNELRSQTGQSASINTIISAMLWYVISRTQIRRLKESEEDLDVGKLSSIILLAKSMRGEFMNTGFIGNNAWIGNANMMCLPPAGVPYSWFDGPNEQDHAFPDILPKITDLINRSIASTSLELVAGFLKQMIKSSYNDGFDFTTKLKEAPLYRSQNFSSTNISNLEFYQDFGPDLGRVQYVRPLAASLDGVSGAVVIPRKRGDCWSEDEKNTLEILLGVDTRDVDTIVNSRWLRPSMLSDPA